MAMTPREHIEEIRRSKFSIGGEPNPLTEDLHHAVKNLSAELYAKDVHFLMELIQNAEDNEYLDGDKPSLQFLITSRDITLTGSSSTLLIFNNERGFSKKNIESICSVGRSTKKGNRQGGYIGEKGIGFKSVFLITSHPYIFSNRYQIRFSEDPDPGCGIGYMVPEWVDQKPTISEIQQIYGSSQLPSTIIILPLKPDKEKVVKQQLSSVQPEILLFLSKIKQLSIGEDNAGTDVHTIGAISISSETDFQTRKNIDAESYTLHLSAEERGDKGEADCSYYMWRQKFPVKQEMRVDRRMEIEQLVITLAFPYGERLNRGKEFSGVYAFLPTEMVTDFPFIIQADFLLASSRETILMDNKWNKGILNCVPSAFINAFVSLVKSAEDAPLSSLTPMFNFLPLKECDYPVLNEVRTSIRDKLTREAIIPCETYTKQKLFCKSHEAGRLASTFWSILIKAREQGVCLQDLSTYGKYIVHSSFDNIQYDEVLSFLDVQFVHFGWYIKFFQGSGLISGVSDDLYLEILCFVADNWESLLYTDIMDIQALKVIDESDREGVLSFRNGDKIFLSSEPHQVKWLIKWNREFKYLADCYFVPESIQMALERFPQKESLKKWLRDHVGVDEINMYDYAHRLICNLRGDRGQVIASTHFIYHSLSKEYLSDREVTALCNSLPVIDKYGCVSKVRNGVLVPATVSKWAELLNSNPWRAENYIELGADYINSGWYGGEYTESNKLLNFLKDYIGAQDIPYLAPPDASFPTASSALTKQNALLLLHWIQNLRNVRARIPETFLRCIKEGCWLKTSLGFKPPSKSFFPSSQWGTLAQKGSVLVDIPVIDEQFYDHNISSYELELKEIGVAFGFEEACEFIGKHLMSLAASSALTRDHVYAMLDFIRFLREKYLSPAKFIESVKKECWLMTSQGVKPPVGSVLKDPVWDVASQISCIPFIEENYYGKEIRQYSEELKLLGVVVEFNEHYQIIADNLNLPNYLNSLKSEAILLLLKLIQKTKSSDKIVIILKSQRWVKTSTGYKLPSESFLPNSEWESMLHIVDDLPVVDESFYGSNIISYKDQLQALGVVVTFDGASKAVAHHLKVRSCSSALAKDNVFSLLKFYENLDDIKKPLPPELRDFIFQSKWLHTCLGLRAVYESILFDSSWESLRPVTNLPFVDEGFYGESIYSFSDILKKLGVIHELSQGSVLIANAINLPTEPSKISSSSMLSLLECVKHLRKTSSSLPEYFMKGISKKCLKTTMGFKSPTECLLFTSKWQSFLHREDAPFIDDQFYGTKISSHCEELKAVGVIVDPDHGCSVVANSLISHSQLEVIRRIYKYLCEFNWKPDNSSTCFIWIPMVSGGGTWVSSQDCVLHDKDNLFGQQLHVLDKHYDANLHPFFSCAFEVRSHPTTENYCRLWKEWEETNHQLTHAECVAFWTYISKHWNSGMQKLLADSVTRVPVMTVSGKIRLADKREAFIPDDLQLKDVIQKTSCESIFVWYPQQCLHSIHLSKFFSIYASTGVQYISQSVQKVEDSTAKGNYRDLGRNNGVIQMGLIKIILAYLADTAHKFSAESRHEIVKPLLDLTVLETDEQITVHYKVGLLKRSLNIEAVKMIRWERESSKLLVQKFNREDEKSCIEFATFFSEVLSEGLLWNNTDQVSELSELIKLGSLLNFKVEAIDFLLKTKNLQLFVEDEEFLASAFPSAYSNKNCAK